MDNNLGKYAILFAEDSKIMQKIIGMMLKKMNCHPLVVDNGLQARDILLSENPPQIAILDWDMPGADGIDLCKEVKERPDGKNVYVIILTIHESEDAKLAYSCGADKFISKDAGIEAFMEALDEAAGVLDSASAI